MVGVASRCEWWAVGIRGLGRRRGGKLSIPGPCGSDPASATILPRHARACPLSCAGCLGPSFPAPSSLFPHPHPHLPGGLGRPGEEGATEGHGWGRGAPAGL